MTTKDKDAKAAEAEAVAEEEATEEAAAPTQSPLGTGEPRNIPDLDARYRAAGVDPNKFES